MVYIGTNPLSGSERLALPEKHHPDLSLPSRAPVLNPVENVWQYLRQNWLSNKSLWPLCSFRVCT